MKLFLFSFCWAMQISAAAQKDFIKELKLTETHFALESQIIGIKSGFLKNMDTSAIGMNNKGYIRMFPLWSARNEVSSTLLWEPITVFSSDGGKWGSTHGPWYTKDSTGKLVNPGYFFTIWQRTDTSSPYHFTLDIGIQLEQAATVKSASELRHHEVAVKQTSYRKLNDINILTKAFNVLAAENLKAALKKYALAESAFLVSGLGRVLHSETDKPSVFDHSFQFKKAGSKILDDGNAWFEYGTFSTSFLKEKEKQGYFVHVWAMDKNSVRLVTALYKWD